MERCASSFNENGKFLMWYGGQNDVVGNGGILQTGFAISEDGLNWVKEANNPVLPAGGPGTLDAAAAFAGGIFKTDAATYKMLYGATSLSTFFGGMLATLNLPTSDGADEIRSAN
ncbi:MAG: hypothetical protein L0287_28460 [Anaerolineae bacterium]|nr:hypothetical protein [Anaerolineae bacterium]MCI0695455.1 hypothetical protein [candidate division KSB1 bacterium]